MNSDNAYRGLSPAQVAQYRSEGYTVGDGLLRPAAFAALQEHFERKFDALPDKLPIVALLHHAAVLEHHDQVGVADGFGIEHLGRVGGAIRSARAGVRIERRS